MIKVINAWTQRGWSPADYLIDDSRLTEIVGREYRTVEHAARAARARADERGYASFEYELRGVRYLYDDSPPLPGRSVQRIRELR